MVSNLFISIKPVEECGIKVNLKIMKKLFKIMKKLIKTEKVVNDVDVEELEPSEKKSDKKDSTTENKPQYNNKKSLKSLLNKLKKIEISALYDYKDLIYPKNEAETNENKKDKHIFESFILDKFQGKVPFSSFIGNKEFIDLYQFFDTEFDNMEIFYYHTDYSLETFSKDGYITFSKVKISAYPGLIIAFKYFDNIFLFNGYSIYCYYLNHTNFHKGFAQFAPVISKFSIAPEKQKNHVHMIMRDCNGFYLKEFNIEETDSHIIKNYDDDFLPIDKLIKKKLTDTNKGIILLHGERGTGKTFYIRDLTSKIDKKFIFVPSFLSVQLTNTDFISFLVKTCTNSILIFEDAEKIIKSREDADYYNTISDLLNLGDGILGDVIQSQIICTFNTALNKIDEALLRPGRLIAEYEFKKLSWKKSQEVAKNIKKKLTEEKEYSLAEIYNSDDLPLINKKFVKEKVMGFTNN
jgi:hypothetical protein